MHACIHTYTYIQVTADDSTASMTFFSKKAAVKRAIQLFYMHIHTCIHTCTYTQVTADDSTTSITFFSKKAAVKRAIQLFYTAFPDRRLHLKNSETGELRSTESSTNRNVDIR